MSKTQLLLFTISILPFASTLALNEKLSTTKFSTIIFRLLPILFAVNLVGLWGSNYNGEVLTLIGNATSGMSLSLTVTDLTLKFLILLNFLWLVFAFHSHRFLSLVEVTDTQLLRIFSGLIIAFVSLIILSENLLTILFFYGCLLVLSHFFSIKFLTKGDHKSQKIFSFLHYLEATFFFLAAVITYKIADQIGSIKDEFLLVGAKSSAQFLVLALFLAAIFLSVFIPAFLLYRAANTDLIATYNIFLLASGLGNLCIITKVIFLVFGSSDFAILISNFAQGLFLRVLELALFTNIVAASVFLVLSKNFKSSFFYLFFQQLLLTLLTILLFSAFKEEKILLAIVSFSLSLTLIFFCFSNLEIYLTKAENRRLGGLFSGMKITPVLMIFGVLSLIGITPTGGMIEKFSLAQILLHKKLFITIAAFIISSLSLIFFFGKMSYLIFAKKEGQALSAKDLELAKNIDSDSNLILSSSLIVIAMILTLLL